MTSPTTDKKRRKRTKTPAPLTGANISPPSSETPKSSGTPQKLAPITTKTEDDTLLSLHNPNRFSLPSAESLHASRLINPSVINLEDAQRLRNAGGKTLTTISIFSVQGEKTLVDELQVKGTHSIGLCIRDREKLRFMHYPSQEALDDVLPHVLQTAMQYVPALSDVYLSTHHKLLWDTRNHTTQTAERMRDLGINFRARHPLAGDIGTTLAKLSALGITGPILTDYHLYTASITDEERSYAAALLWGKNYAAQFIQTLPYPDLAQAEITMAEWALKLLPENSLLLIHNANPRFGQIWRTPEILKNREYEHIRLAMRESGKLMRAKHILPTIDKEKPHELLIRAARDVVAGRYAAADSRHRERKPSQKSKRTTS